MSLPVHIVPYSAERRQEIADLLNVCLGHKLTGERDAVYWSWKHERNPFGRSVLLLAEVDGRLAGVRAFMRWQLTANGHVVHAAKPVDTVTHPDYQRRGIFKRLTTEACDVARRDGIGLLFNTPNGNSLPGYLKLGWQRVTDLPLRVRLQRPFGASWRMAAWKLRNGEVPAQERFFRDAPTSAADVLDRESVGIRELLAQARASAQLRTVRTIEFLRWRYASHPHIPYFAETIADSGRLDGVVFYRTNFRSGLREVMIDDLLAREGAADSVKRLLGKLLRRTKTDYVLAHGAEESSIVQTLRKSGFHRLPRRRITLVARTLADEVVPDPLQASNWSLSLGDLEGL